MDVNKIEAMKAKEMAEKHLAKKEFSDAKMHALKALSLCPSLDGISQTLAALDVHIASQIKVNGEADFYAVLGVSPRAGDEIVKKQYRKLAVNLHPDKNKSVGAEGAFKFVSEAWSILSDSSRRELYDQRRSMSLAESPKKPHSSGNQTSVQSPKKPHASTNQTSAVNGTRKKPKLSDSNGSTNGATFWTTCSSCKMQFEYLKVYLNCNLTCHSCWKTFRALETGKSPTSISTPFVPSTTRKNTNILSETNRGTYYAAHNFHYIDSEISSFPCGIVTTDAPSMSVQWVPLHGNGANIRGPPVALPPLVVSRSYEKAKRASELSRSPSMASNHPGCTPDQSGKKMKSEHVASTNNISATKSEHLIRVDSSEGPKRIEKDVLSNKTDARSSHATDQPDQPPFLFNFDARKLLIEKTKREINKKLEEIQPGASLKVNYRRESYELVNGQTKFVCDAAEVNAVIGVNISNSNIGQCSSFYNFDMDRLDVCFKPQQVWALYDDDDGMPRFYAFIHKIISLNPFRVQLSYLNPRSNNEFASVDWLASGFYKTCGTFALGRCEVMDTVNVFSHVVEVEWRIQGIVRVLPRRGEIWALYKYWSPEWDDTISTEVRHQYEAVEVLESFSEELGVRVIYLAKMPGFRSLYKRQKNTKTWIPKNEMYRFSHQVPSRLIIGDVADALSNRRWELDPLATPTAKVIESVGQESSPE